MPRMNEALVAPTVDELEQRLKVLLPPEYQDRYEEVKPLSMGSTGLRYGPDGLVAWDQIWGSFCDLAMAGGPPHRGSLLEPGTREEIASDQAAYLAVVTEICRGIALLTGLHADAAPVPGWVRMYCDTEVMAGWLARAIVMENISVYVQGAVVCLPAGPHYRVVKEIKNVLTSVAKTTHYWMGHASSEKHRAVARLLMKMDRESSLLQPGLLAANSNELRESLTSLIKLSTGLSCVRGQSNRWLGLDCKSIDNALRMMRLLIAGNVLARREERVVFVPLNPVLDPEGDLLAQVIGQAAR